MAWEELAKPSPRWGSVAVLSLYVASDPLAGAGGAGLSGHPGEVGEAGLSQVGRVCQLIELHTCVVRLTKRSELRHGAN